MREPGALGSLPGLGLGGPGSRPRADAVGRRPLHPPVGWLEVLPRWRGTCCPRRAPAAGGCPPLSQSDPSQHSPAAQLAAGEPGRRGCSFRGGPAAPEGAARLVPQSPEGNTLVRPEATVTGCRTHPSPALAKRAAVSVREQSQERDCSRGPAPSLRALTSPSFPPAVRGLGQRRSSWAPVLLRGGGDRPRRGVPNALPLDWDQEAPVSTPGCRPGSSRPRPKARGKQSSRSTPAHCTLVSTFIPRT